MKFEAEIPDELVDRLAKAVAARVGELLEERRAATEYMTVDEAAAYLRCSKTRVYRLAASGELPHYKLGSRSLFSQREIDAWLGHSRSEPPNHQERVRQQESSEGSRPSMPSRIAEDAALRARLPAATAKRKPTKRTRPVPLPLSADEEHKAMWAKALGMSRAEFDLLTPREFEKLWDERATRINELSPEKTEALFDWDPKVERLSEMTIAELEELAEKLVEGSSSERDSG
jgi:PTS system nitrogen regulatory IIA component